MYNIGGWLSLLSPRAMRGVQAGISRNVLLLGLTSLFTDISSEMVVSVLPIYLVTFLRLSPVQFGLIDGLYQGVAALVQLASGVIADRWRRLQGSGLAWLRRFGGVASWAAGDDGMDRNRWRAHHRSPRQGTEDGATRRADLAQRPEGERSGRRLVSIAPWTRWEPCSDRSWPL